MSTAGGAARARALQAEEIETGVGTAGPPPAPRTPDAARSAGAPTATAPSPPSTASDPSRAPAPPAASAPPHAYLSIGQVMQMLKDEFPDITISKVRYLEAEGLVTPQRTDSNYRKFSREDVDRLRYVLSAQRDHYLPLKVIRSHLESMDRGFEPPPLVGEPRLPEHREAEEARHASDTLLPRSTDLRLSRPEMLRESGLSDPQLRELETFGLIETRSGHFDADALDTARIVAELARYGDISGRHLARFRNAADREVDLCAQVVTPIMRQRDADARARAEATAAELAAHFVALHAGLVRNGLRRMMDGS